MFGPDWLHLGRAAGAPELIANAVLDGLSQVRAKGVSPSGFERVQPPESVHQNVLDHVGRICEPAHPARHASLGPPVQPSEMTSEEQGERALVPAAGAIQEVERRP